MKDGQGVQYAKNFFASSLSPGLAVLITNPVEVVKVRQQIENAGKGKGPRSSMLTVVRQIYSAGGVGGLQAGLQMAVVRESSKAFFRIGAFQPILDQLHDRSLGPPPVYKRMAAGMFSGAVGSLVCNPIELVKTRQQGASAGDTSYKYRGPIHGLRKLHATEGVKGMWRGTGISMIRSASVTGPHLTTYSYVKEVFVEKQWMRDSTPLHILASLCGGFTGIVCNHPFDLVRNRLYNQPLTADGKGVLYDGVRDCMKKLAKTEGLKGFYRGFVAHYMRVGPHYVITFSILEQVRKALSPSEE